MAQYRQSGFGNGGGGFARNGAAPDHVPIVIRSSTHKQQQPRHAHQHHRRFKFRKISIGAFVVILSVAFTVSVVAFLYITSQNKGKCKLVDTDVLIVQSRRVISASFGFRIVTFSCKMKLSGFSISLLLS